MTGRHWRYIVLNIIGLAACASSGIATVVGLTALGIAMLAIAVIAFVVARNQLRGLPQ